MNLALKEQARQFAAAVQTVESSADEEDVDITFNQFAAMQNAYTEHFNIGESQEGFSATSPSPAPAASSSSAKAKLAKSEGLKGVKEGVKLKLDEAGTKGVPQSLVSRAGVRVFARKPKHAEQAEEEEDPDQVFRDAQAAENDL